MLTRDELQEEVERKSTTLNSLHNVDPEIITIYSDFAFDELSQYLGYDFATCDTFTDKNKVRILVRMVLYQITVRGVEGGKNFNEAGQSMSFYTVGEMLKEFAVNRRPINRKVVDDDVII